MKDATKTTYIQIQAPDWVTPDHFRRAAPILVRVLDEMKGKPQAMRGYIACANKDGFPIKAGFATDDQLPELCIRAFWWIFERVCEAKRRA